MVTFAHLGFKILNLALLEGTEDDLVPGPCGM
jgi:hypothetical protein